MAKVADLILGTKVDTKGLKDGLNKVETEVKKTDDKTKIKPKIIADGNETDAYLQKLQSQLDRKGLKIKKIETNIEGAEKSLQASEKELETVREKNKALIESYNRYKELLALQESGQKLGYRQSYDLEMLDKQNLEWSYDAVQKEVEQIKVKQQEILGQIGIWKEELRINQSEYDGIVNKAEEYKNKNKETKEETQDMFMSALSTSGRIGAVIAGIGTGLKTVFSGLINGVSKLGTAIKDKVVSKIHEFKEKMSGIGNSIKKTVKNVLKWGLAILGLRTAYNIIRSAVSSITSENETLKNQIETIKTGLANALEPVITRIVNLIATLMSFVGSLIKQLTGKDIFAGASKNLSSGASSAKEINKQLAGFDEMNVLSDNSSSGGSGSDVNTGELGEVNQKLLDTLNKIKDLIFNGEWGQLGKLLSDSIIAGLNIVTEKIKSIPWEKIGEGISAFFTNIDFSGILVGLVEVFGEALLGFQEMWLSIDWPTILGNLGQGIADAIFKIDDYIKQIKWDELGKQFGDTFTSIPWGDIGSSILETLWDSLKGIVDFFLGIDWGQVAQSISDAVNDWIKTVTKKFEETDWKQLGEDIVDAIFDFIENIDWLELGMNILKGIIAGIEAIIDLVIGVFSKIVDKIKEFLGIHSPSTLFEGFGGDIIQGLINGISALIDKVVEVFKKIWDKIKQVFSNVGSWFKEKFSDAWTKIKNVFSKVGEFFGGIWDTIKSKFTDIGQKIGTAVGGAFKSAVNAVLSTIENVLNTPIRAINGMINVINKLPGVNIGKLSTFSLPRLASGAIINQPGRGIPVGGAVAGEAGREGILPLTDERAMAQLGREIGRWINVNATIPVNIGNRQIARIIQQLIAERDFVTNS